MHLKYRWNYWKRFHYILEFGLSSLGVQLLLSVDNQIQCQYGSSWRDVAPCKEHAPVEKEKKYQHLKDINSTIKTSATGLSKQSWLTSLTFTHTICEKDTTPTTLIKKYIILSKPLAFYIYIYVDVHINNEKSYRSQVMEFHPFLYGCSHWGRRELNFSFMIVGVQTVRRLSSRRDQNMGVFSCKIINI